MAKDAKPVEEGSEAPPKKSKKLLIIILAVVLIVVIGAGGAAYVLLKGSNHSDEGDEDVAEETTKHKKKDKKKDPHAMPVFVNLDTFTVNLIPETGDQYLQVVLSLEIEDVAEEAALKAQMPKIRNNLTLLLSSKKASELLPKEGKEQLAQALKNEINSVISPATKKEKGETVAPEGPVISVLFTSFIIQ